MRITGGRRLIRMLGASCLLLVSMRMARAQGYSLEVYTGLGTYGIVTAQPGNNTCSSHCTWSYPAGTSITLLPTAPVGKTFLAWETCNGSFLSSSPIYNLTLNADQCVQAYFTASSGPYTLTVYKGTPGLANGSISGTGGFYCGPTAGSAGQSYANGTVVTLTNTPASGWCFGYWEYNGVAYTNSTFTLTLDRDQLVQTVFIHSNLPPAVSITTPTNNAPVTVCSMTPVSVTASDPNYGGSITNIQLFLNSVLVAHSASSPLNYVVTNQAVLGTNTLLAEAADNFGLTSWSSPVSFTVESPGTNQLQVLGIVPTNAFEFCLCGLTNRVYAIQTSSNLLQHWSHWESVTNSPWGVLPVIDQSISNSSRRFYRAGLATDLACLSATLSPTNPVAGDTVTASITITNGSCLGASVSAGAFHVGFYGLATTQAGLSTLAPFLEEPVSSCAANGTVSFNLNLSIPQNLTPGTYYLGFNINSEAEVPECNLDNNGIWWWVFATQ